MILYRHWATPIIVFNRCIKNWCAKGAVGGGGKSHGSEARHPRGDRGCDEIRELAI